MKVLFLTHAPNEAYRRLFMNEINARVKILPFKKYIKMIKKYYFLGYLYPYISLIYSFFIRVDEDILIADGGSCLFVASHIKKRKNKIKLIYLDNDTLFYNLCKKNSVTKEEMKFFIDSIDGIISDSEQNKEYALKVLDVPIHVCSPYPKSVKKDNIKRKNYGLYVGRLDPDKDIKKIIQFGLQCPYFEKFVVVGDGILRDYVKKLSKENSKLVYLGTRSNIEKYYNECKFLVHFSEYDPHPRTTMEAAICGCFPIISENIGTRYLFDDLFILDDLNDFTKINNKIEYILENENQARKLLERKLSLIPTKQKSLKKFREIYFGLLRKI